MNSNSCVVYSEGAYTKSYADDFIKRWEDLFASKLESFDISSLLKTKNFQISMSEDQESNFVVDETPTKVVLAFHPTFGFAAAEDEYLEHSMSAAYANCLIAASCPNPPFVGQWGLHFSWITSRRILFGLGFPLASVRPPSAADLGRPRIKLHSVFHVQNVLELKAESKANNESLILEQLTYDEFKNQKRTIHSIGGKAYLYDADRVYRGEVSELFNFAGLHQTLGTQAVELVAVEINQQLQWVGFNPTLTFFPNQSLQALKNYMDGMP